jgi:flagellar hook assembly protein FlgD
VLRARALPLEDSATLSVDAVIGVPASVGDQDHRLTARPNPASASIDIQYGMTAERSIDLKVYDVSGRLVRSLVTGSMLAGVQNVAWDLLDDTGQKVAPGTYFLCLTSDNGAAVTEPITIVR